MRGVQRGDVFSEFFAWVGVVFLLESVVVAGFTSD